MLILLFSLLVVVFAYEDAKHVTVFNNGRSTNGVPLTVARSDLDDLDAWLVRLQTLLPIEKNHLAPGEARVAEVYSSDGLRIMSVSTVQPTRTHSALSNSFHHSILVELPPFGRCAASNRAVLLFCRIRLRKDVVFISLFFVVFAYF